VDKQHFCFLALTNGSRGVVIAHEDLLMSVETDQSFWSDGRLEQRQGEQEIFWKPPAVSRSGLVEVRDGGTVRFGGIRVEHCVGPA
jgi:hypothetical protein